MAITLGFNFNFLTSKQEIGWLERLHYDLFSVECNSAE